MAATSVAVVGAGVFGLGAAIELQRRGHRVTVFERYGLPSSQGASVDSSRMVRADYGADGFFVDLGLRAIARWHEWNARSAKLGTGPLYHPVGVVFFRDGDIDAGGYEHDSMEQFRVRARPVRRLGPGTPTQAIPAWAAGDVSPYTDGYLQPNAGYANARATVEFMAHTARELGVTFCVGETAGACVGYVPGTSPGSVAGIVTADGRQHAADKVLVAAGPWSPTLVPELRGLIQVVGQPLVYVKVPEPLRAMFAPGNCPAFTADISRQGWYGFPADDASGGRIKVGLHGNGFIYEAPAPDGQGVCSMPAPPGRARPPEATVRSIKAFIDRSFPALRGQPVDETRFCYYCDSWDSYFYIDQVPQRPGLYVATGGSGHGFKFAPVLGEIIADAVEDRPGPQGAPFLWRARPSTDARVAEDCRMLNSGPERMVLSEPSSKL